MNDNDADSGLGAGYGSDEQAAENEAQGGFGGMGESMGSDSASLAAAEARAGVPGAGSAAVGGAIAGSQGLMDAISQAQSPENVMGAALTGLSGVLGGKLGGAAASTVGGAMFGPFGAIALGVLGAKYGKQAAQNFSVSMMSGIKSGTISTAEDVNQLAEQHGISGEDAHIAITDATKTAFEGLQGGQPMAIQGGPAGTQASYQQQALDYLKEREALPRQLSEGALKQLGGVYGLPGGEGTQESFLSSIKESPLYQQMIQGGEEAVMRHASATGGLRSGNVQDALARSSEDVLSSLYQQRIGGLAGMAGLPSGAANIATGMTNIGETLAAGQLAGERQAEIDKANKYALYGTAYKELGGLEGISEGLGKAWDYASSYF